MLHSIPFHWSEVNSEGQPIFKGRGPHEAVNAGRPESWGPIFADWLPHGVMCLSQKRPGYASGTHHPQISVPPNTKGYLLLILLGMWGSQRGAAPGSRSTSRCHDLHMPARGSLWQGGQSPRDLHRQGNALVQTRHESLPPASVSCPNAGSGEGAPSLVLGREQGQRWLNRGGLSPTRLPPMDDSCCTSPLSKFQAKFLH